MRSRAHGDGGKVEQRKLERRGALCGGGEKGAFPPADIHEPPMPVEPIGVEDSFRDKRLGARHQLAVCAAAVGVRLRRVLIRVARPIGGIGPEPGQGGLVFSPQQRDGVAEIAVEKIMVRDKGRNRRIADHRSAEIVEREAVVRQRAQKPERRRGFEEPSRGWNAQGHPRRERLASLRTRPKKIEDLEFHTGARTCE